MKSGAVVEGSAAMERLLGTLAPRSASNIMRNVTTDVARVARDKAKDNVAVDTGQLKKAIKAKRRKSSRDIHNASVDIARGAGEKYVGYHWHFLEYGTVKQRKQPFILPAILDTRREMPALMRQLFGKRFEKEVARLAKRAAKAKAK